MVAQVFKLFTVITMALAFSCTTRTAPKILMPKDSSATDTGAVTVEDASPSDSSPTDSTPLDASVDAGIDDVGLEDATALDAEPLDTGVEIPRTRKSLVLALDGVRPDAFGHANTPNYDALINGTWQAGYKGAYTETAQNLYDASTVSGPNHAAIMTGATATQHGVTGNGNVSSGDFDTYRHYLRLIEDDNSNRNTAYLFTWGTDREIVSGADYIVDSDDAGNVARAVAMLEGSHSDNSGTGGTQWNAGTNPDAIFLFLDDPDGAGHSHGFEINISEYITEIENCDAQLGLLLRAIENRPSFNQEDWQIIMTSDHGGFGRSHGAYSATDHTIPFLIASRHVSQGRLPSGTQIIDVVPTVLEHMEVAKPSYLMGQTRGSIVEAAPPTMIKQDLIRYFRFEGNFANTSSGADATIGMNSDHDPRAQENNGKFGGHLEIRNRGGGRFNASYLTINGDSELDMGDNDNFTVTLWFRSEGRQDGDPVILGNKDWSSGQNTGWLVLANEGENNSFGTNFAGSSSDRLDLEDISYNDTDWWFIASIFDANGNAVMYAGREIGGLRWMALDATGVGDMTSSLPLNIGQDGTGRYGDNLDGDIDDLAIWRRALSHDEILRLYAGGAGAELHGL